MLAADEASSLAGRPVVCKAQPREISRNLSIGCGEGLGEVSPSVKITPDWANDLFCSSVPARERVTWELSHTCLSLAGGMSLHCHVLPVAVQWCLGQSSSPPSWNTLLCYVLPRWGKKKPTRFLRSLLHSSPGAWSLTLPQPAARAKMRTLCQNLQNANQPTGSLLEQHSALGHAWAPVVNFIFVSRSVRTII